MPSRNPLFVYWDSNVFLAYVNAEPGNVEQIEALWDEISENPDDRIITAMISIVEVAFSSAEKAGTAPGPEIAANMDAMWQDRSVQLVEVSESIVFAAREMIRDALAAGNTLTPLDAIHLAAAMWVDRNIGRVQAFHSYDQKLRKYQAFTGIPIMEPAPATPRLPLDFGSDSPSGGRSNS